MTCDGQGDCASVCEESEVCVDGDCECAPGFIPCDDACVEAECCGSDTSNCVNFNFDPECVTCTSGICNDSGTDFDACNGNDGFCLNGVCLDCLAENVQCQVDIQCCSSFCNPTSLTCQFT